jgi:uncharacterized membrane protein YgcG
MRLKRLILATVVAFMAMVLSVSPVALAQTQTLYWERFDVDIAVQSNGDLRVEETQVINFTSGVFTQGFAQLPTKNTEGISEITVSENGQPYTQASPLCCLSKGEYSLELNKSGIIQVTWTMGATSQQTRSFVLAYTVHGAIRRYPQGNEFQWNAISPALHDFEIRESTVTLHMPPGATIGLADYLVPPDFQGVPMDLSLSADKLSATWVAKQTLAPSQGIQVVVQFAPNSVAGSTPIWQAAFDRQSTWNKNVKPSLDLALLTLSLLLLLGGPAAVYLLWYLRGRDPKIDAVPEYITAPPAGLQPGIAGTLVDEKADVADIVATLMDLARRGYLAVEESSETSAFRLVSKQFTFRQTLDGKRLEDLADYERQLYNAIFRNRTSVSMRELNQSFYSNIPGLQQALYNSAVKLGFFSASPSSVRSQYGCLGGFALVAAFIGGIVAAVAFSDSTSTLICPFLAIAVVGILLMWVGQHMPVKTRKGAEAAALSRAFKNYLVNLEKYAKPEQVTEQFDQYLPFAIAFGLERTWINRFSRIPTTAMPGWYYPVGRPFRAGPIVAGSRPVGQGAAAVPATGVPSLQGMSNSLSGGLQSMSDGLNTMLNSASRTLTSTPPSSSSSSGGRSFSGGGGGFSSSGGSGGGGRGFR